MSEEYEYPCEYYGCDQVAVKDTGCCNRSYCMEHYVDVVSDRECEMIHCEYHVEEMCDHCWEDIRPCGH